MFYFTCVIIYLLILHLFHSFHETFVVHCLLYYSFFHCELYTSLYTRFSGLHSFPECLLHWHWREYGQCSRYNVMMYVFNMFCCKDFTLLPNYSILHLSVFLSGSASSFYFHFTLCTSIALIGSLQQSLTTVDPLSSNQAYCCRERTSAEHPSFSHHFHTAFSL